MFVFEKICLDFDKIFLDFDKICLDFEKIGFIQKFFAQFINKTFEIGNWDKEIKLGIFTIT